MPNTISLQEISEPNAAWGICGFVSSIGALCYEGRLVLKVPNNYLNSILIWAVREYLHHLLKGGSPLVQKIETFTAGYTNAEGKQPYQSFTVKGFVDRMWVVKAGDRSFGIAMPPDAVVDFLIYHGAQGAHMVHPLSKPESNNYGHRILGLCTPGKADPATYDGLRHWVYMRDAWNAYNYGKLQRLKDILAAKDRPREVKYEIAL